MIDLRGNLKLVNAKGTNMFGYGSDELVAVNCAAISVPDQAFFDRKNTLDLISDKYLNYSRERIYVHKDGSIIWGLISVSVIGTSTKAPSHFVSQIIDTT